MFDQDENKRIAGLYIVVTVILLGINIGAYFYANHKVQEMVGDGYENLVIEKSVAAVSTIMVNGWVSLLVGAASWLVPQINLVRVLNGLEVAVYRRVCLLVGVIYHGFIGWSLVSTILQVRSLLLEAGMGLFQYLLSLV